MRSIEDFRNKLQNGDKLIGGAITLSEIMSAEIVAHFMDFLWIDMEHGALDIGTVEGQILMAKKNRKPALVRVPKLDTAWIKMVLDAGAHGVIVPQVYSAEEVRRAVENARYFPVGKRGYGPRLPNVYGELGSGAEYIHWANKNIYLAIQLETKEAYEQLDSILEIDGYDALCIGPADLALSLGYHGEYSSAPMTDILSVIIPKIKRAGKDVGFGMAFNLDYAKIALKMGVDWLQIASDFDFIGLMAKRIMQDLKKV